MFLLIHISSWDCSQPKDGEPVVTVLSAGPIKVKDSHFSRPRGSSDLLRAPSRFPVPQSRVVLREISVVWHLYGGKDFGSKPMSAHTQHANRYDRQAISLLPEVVSLSSHSRGFSLFFSSEVGRPPLAPVGPRLASPLPLAPRTPGAGPEAAAGSTRCWWRSSSPRYSSGACVCAVFG